VALYADAVVKIDPLVKRGRRILCLAPGYIRLQQAEQAILHDVRRPAEEVRMERKRCPDAVAVDETMLRVSNPILVQEFSNPSLHRRIPEVENVDPAVNTIGAGPVRLRPAPWTVFGFDYEIIAQPGRVQVDRCRETGQTRTDNEDLDAAAHRLLSRDHRSRSRQWRFALARRLGDSARISRRRSYVDGASVRRV
jgi:hypothetical protein